MGFKDTVKKYTVHGAFVAGIALGGGIGVVAVPKSGIPKRPALEIQCPTRPEPYTKISNLFGHNGGKLTQGESLTVYLIPSWGDSAAECVIAGAGNGTYFSVKIDTVLAKQGE
jgi:hypothetical protein